MVHSLVLKSTSSQVAKVNSLLRTIVRNIIFNASLRRWHPPGISVLKKMPTSRGEGFRHRGERCDRTSFNILSRIRKTVPSIVCITIDTADYLANLYRCCITSSIYYPIARSRTIAVVISVINLLPSTGGISRSITASFIALGTVASVTCFM